MVIYGEYLFLENGVAGLIILSLTGKICGLRLSAKMIALGSILCGIYSFILFWEGIYWWLAVIFKICFSIGIVCLSFSILNWKNLMKAVLVFYVVSFTLGGIIIASLYFFNSTGLTWRGVFYIGKLTYIKIFLIMLLAWLIIYIFSCLLKARLKKGRMEAELWVTISNQTAILKGFIDTGNFLREPISGRPVCIAARKAIEGLIPDNEQFCIIPYKSIDKEEGVLYGMRIDNAKLFIENNKPKSVDIVLAVSKIEQPIGGNCSEYDVILHEALIERGVLTDG